jgi:hypothetical protein
VEYSAVLFREIQRSRQWWLYVVIFMTCIATAGVFGYIFVMQVVLNHQIGDHPMSNNALTLTAILVIGVDAIIVWLVLASNMVTEVRPDGLFIRYYPFHPKFRKIPIENALSIEVVTYNPIADYGGWGLRYGKNGRAYNPCGNRGVRITKDDGKHILIGSQKPEELLDAINYISH